MSRLERWTGQSVGIEHQEAKAMLGVSTPWNPGVKRPLVANASPALNQAQGALD